ncbi:hypothetical protein DFH09DRAFT_1096548 [Mycena vulgaris]|nr:hypothetical protein DFH09DRAFT_1096548 [Mycena vulgaris]
MGVPAVAVPRCRGRGFDGEGHGGAAARGHGYATMRARWRVHRTRNGWPRRGWEAFEEKGARAAAAAGGDACMQGGVDSPALGLAMEGRRVRLTDTKMAEPHAPNDARTRVRGAHVARAGRGAAHKSQPVLLVSAGHWIPGLGARSPQRQTRVVGGYRRARRISENDPKEREITPVQTETKGHHKRFRESGIADLTLLRSPLRPPSLIEVDWEAEGYWAECGCAGMWA